LSELLLLFVFGEEGCSLLRGLLLFLDWERRCPSLSNGCEKPMSMGQGDECESDGRAAEWLQDKERERDKEGRVGKEEAET